MKTSNLTPHLLWPCILLIPSLIVPAQENQTEEKPAVVTFRNSPQLQGGITLNFKNAPLGDVLSYLSEAAGFVVIQEVPVSGNINVVSRQPLNSDEAVDLLNAVLTEKGFVAIRSGRILKIISKKNAPKRDIPIETGSNPSSIPKKDGMVTQIMPVQHADATKLLDNIRPLLADDVSISANESSNAIVITDTQTNIRRVAEIIQALDTSISDINEIRIFQLQNADAGELATLLNQLYDKDSGQNQGQNGRAAFFQQFARGNNRNNRGGGQSDRSLLQTKVNAVADPRTNSLLITASRETMLQIAEMVGRLDSSQEKKQRVYVYPLEYADVNNVANILKGIYAKDGSKNTTQDPAASRLGQRSQNGASNQNPSIGNNNNNNRRNNNNR